MLNRFHELFARAVDICRTEGFTTLLGRSITFVRRGFFQYGNYYLYEHSLQERDESIFLPETKDFIFKIVNDNQEADELARTTGHDFRRRFVKARKSLDKGAIAFCIFVNSEIAHIGWVALSEEAKKTVDPRPYKVFFTRGEACTGGTETIFKYRRKGFMTYVYFKRLQFLKERGKLVARTAVAIDNVASHRMHQKFNPHKYAQGRHLKFLSWDLWREKPLVNCKL